ncbi:organic cation transporter protein-like [Antedon mediterranea]|uniref:organic cation transporter protein-like n=1 Tax=Antedon mediterranea TaxID=105859 RepID=UPI003AF4DC0A
MNGPEFICHRFIPESVRWLISQKRFDEAEDLIKECAKVNKVSLEELPDNLFEEQKLEMEKAGHDVTYTVVDLFRTPNLRMKTINILYNWLVNSLVYYGLSLSTASLGGRDYLAFILSGVVEIPAYIVAIPAIGTFGRKRVLCAFMVLGGVACLTTVWVPMGWGRTTVSLIGKFGIAASFGIIYVFSAELYPTPVRSVGMGTSSMSARVGGILAPIILEIGKIWPPLPLMIFSFMSISAGLLALLLPETLNKELPETIEDGETIGKRKKVKEPTSKPTMVDYCGQVDIESSFTNQAYEVVFLAAGTDHWCKTPQLERQDCYFWGLDTETCNALKYNATIPEDDEDTILRENNCRRCDVTYSEFGEDTERCKLSDPDIEECEDGWEYDRSQYKNTIVQEVSLLSTCPISPLKIGRKSTMFICMFITLVFGVATTVAPGYWYFTIFRFFIGFANIGIYLNSFTLVYPYMYLLSLFFAATELVGPSKRTFVGMVINFFTSAGLITYGILAYFIRDWRWLQFTITVPNFFYFFMIPIIPESVRWLMSKKRFDDAEKVVKECARLNKAETVPKNMFEEERAKVERENETTATVADLFRTPNMRMKTINILYNWLVNSLVYYGLSLSTASLGGRDYLAFILSGCVEIPAYLAAMFGIDRFGRRRCLCVFMLLGGVACFTTIWVPSGWARTTVSLIGKFGISASFGIIYMYSVELYPTPVRSAGMGTSSMSARIGGIIAPIILEIGKVWPPLPLIIFSFMSISAGLLALLLPETLNRELPETMEDGEYFGKKQRPKPQKTCVEKADFSVQTNINSYNSTDVVSGYQHRDSDKHDGQSTSAGTSFINPAYEVTE